MKTRREISLGIRNLIVKLRYRGQSYGEIAKTVELSRASVQTVVKKFYTSGSVKSKQRSGRPKRLNNRDRRYILKKINSNPHISAPKLANKIENVSGKVVHPETVRKFLRSEGFHGRIPRKKPFISAQNIQKRLEFANTHLDKTFEFWKTVLFTDESKFNIFGCDGKGKVWRKTNEELKLKNLKATVKHGGGSVMVWGAMAAAGVGNLVFVEGIMDHRQYLTILQQNLLPSIEKLNLGDQWIFQQDNDPKHTARIVKEWILYNVPKQLYSPPQSPDLNAIEHLWDELERRIRKFEIKNKDSLKTALQQAWAEITPDVTENLVLSMPRRMQAVVDSNGGPTKY